MAVFDEPQLAMKILFVGWANIHTARWISQLKDSGWDLHLFPTKYGREINDHLSGVTIHSEFPNKRLDRTRLRERALFPKLLRRMPRFNKVLEGLGCTDAWRLVRTIRYLKPDIVHSLGVNDGSFFETLEARETIGESFPTWVVSNLGLDIHHYQYFDEYLSKIKKVLALCDFYASECQRDVELAQKYGLLGSSWPVLPQAGGFDLTKTVALRNVTTKPSQRKIVMLKGYQHYCGRALVALKALELVANDLCDYKVILYGVSGDDVVQAAHILMRRTGVCVEILPRVPQEQILELHGRARTSISLSTSDAACTSFLEAMAMGSFPIQSNTSCADEWANDGESVMLVDPDDPHDVARALAQALRDDNLVDSAADKNWETASRKLDFNTIRDQVLDSYRDAASRVRTPKHSESQSG